MLIRGKADALEQAVRNLVENALRYSVSGTMVTIRVAADASVSVIDCGPGVPVEYRDVIFERFHRVDPNVGGAGLGLSIVKSTVNAHAGTIDVADSPNGGAVFTMRFTPVDAVAR